MNPCPRASPSPSMAPKENLMPLSVSSSPPQVGSNFKTPRFPIWVICSESHFSVLFCLKKELLSDWKVERRFDLYYYDGLSRQQDEIRLSVGEFPNVVSFRMEWFPDAVSFQMEFPDGVSFQME